MRNASCRNVLVVLALTAAPAAYAQQVAPAATATPSAIGRQVIRTLPVPEGMIVRSGTYLASGKVLVSYSKPGSNDRRAVNLAVMNDDGTGVRTIFSQVVPGRPKDNGLRFMPFEDNRRIFMGDFVLECAPSLDACNKSTLVPVTYPAEVADGPHISHRWSEMIIAPDNRHIAWTTLLSNFAAAVFTGELRKQGAGYVIAKTRIVSTLEPFKPDPKHPDGVLPQVMRNGEVKQFVHGGTGISLAGGVDRDLPDSVVQDLRSGKVEAVTRTPGYDETTIFSPDERLGLTMTTRFSDSTDLKILDLIPRPYPAALNMGLSMFAYTYGVTGVRDSRPGNVGPALIEIRPSETQAGYLGTNLNTQDGWVFNSPMSWHPGGKKAMWPESPRGGGPRRLQILELPDYRPGKTVAAKVTPDAISYASTDLSVIPGLVHKTNDIDVKVYGKISGYITFKRTASTIEKVYVDFSDDGRSVYTGRETMRLNPRGNSTYVADVRVTGANTGAMDLTMTFGPLGGPQAAGLVFAPDATGKPQTRGYAEYNGTRLTPDKLVP